MLWKKLWLMKGTSKMFAFKSDAAAIRKIVESLTSVVANKPLVPILGNVLITLQSDGNLYMESSDTRLHVKVKIPTTKTVDSGAVCVPADRLTSVIAAANQDSVITFNVSDKFESVISIGSGKDRKQATIKGVAPNDFPKMDSGKTNSTLQLAFDDLRQSVLRTGFTAASDDTNPVLSGINVSLENKVLSFVSTDRYRMSVSKREVSSPVKLSAIVPATSLNQCVAIMDKIGATHDVNMNVLDRSIQIVSGNTIIQVTPISGKYPDVANKLPKSFDMICSVNLKRFMAGVKSIAIFSKLIEISISQPAVAGETSMRLYGGDETGDMEDVFDVRATGRASKVALNLDYLSACLNVMVKFGYNFVSMRFTRHSDSNYITLHPMTDETTVDENYTAFIMPIDPSNA